VPATPWIHARLVRAGYKVAISEQVEDAKEAKVVIRARSRISRQLTLTDDSLEAKSGSVLAAIVSDRRRGRRSRARWSDWLSGTGWWTVLRRAGAVERLADELALIGRRAARACRGDRCGNPLDQLCERLGISPTASGP
jgi:DNA mismatch repair ATPase MutS